MPFLLLCLLSLKLLRWCLLFPLLDLLLLHLGVVGVDVDGDWLVVGVDIEAVWLEGVGIATVGVIMAVLEVCKGEAVQQGGDVEGRQMMTLLCWMVVSGLLEGK